MFFLKTKLTDTCEGARWPFGFKTLDSGSRGWGFEPHSGRSVVSLSKTYLLPHSTGNAQEAVVPSQHD